MLRLNQLVVEDRNNFIAGDVVTVLNVAMGLSAQEYTSGPCNDAAENLKNKFRDALGSEWDIHLTVKLQ